MSRKSFQAELEQLQRNILRTGTLVEGQIDGAVRSLAEMDSALARAVIAREDMVDAMELDIERTCLELIALQQPMAIDLRIIGTALKIVTDLERMADHAVDIARVTIRLEGQSLIKPLIDVPRMANIAQGMIRDSLKAYVDRDVELALRMVERDQDIDHLFSAVFRELLVYMVDDAKIAQATQLLFVVSHLERIADHATNMGEWIVYMVTGERMKLDP